MYDDDMLKDISDSVDLYEYISQQMELEKKGNDYFGHCTLHTDKTPSFCVTPGKNTFYCFSCGRGGGIIGYLMDYEGMRFDEAVEKAAKLANVDLSKMCKSDTIMFLKRLKTWSQKPREPFEHTIISYSEYDKYKKGIIQEWLDEGIKQDVMDLFDIRIDERQNRIVYPVYDIDGKLINVKARTRFKNYKELRIPKYINYYQVGVMDYLQSLNMSLPYIKENNEVIVFESIKSVMKAYGWGFKNCVSAEKHTLTPEQIKLLIKLRVNIVFAYDSDINYYQNDVKQNIDKLKLLTNVFIINDRDKLLGGVNAKNSPADCGIEIWSKLYEAKKKIV